jgi:hypothetical protein
MKTRKWRWRIEESEEIQHNSDRKVGGHRAQKPWRLDGVGMASRIVQ